MSFHDPNSDLSQLNQQAYQHPVQVHALTYALLQRAQKIYRYSEGLFDCSTAKQLVNWQMLPNNGITFPLEDYAGTQEHVSLLGNGYVSFTKPLLLDLGGIAKGFAVDLAIHQLRCSGVESAVVNAGGDLRVWGRQNEIIHIRKPSDPQQLLPIGTLNMGACATSAIYYSAQTLASAKNVSALVNPITQQPVLSKNSLTVLATQAWLADALCKVLAVTEDPEHPIFKRFSAIPFIFNDVV